MKLAVESEGGESSGFLEEGICVGTIVIRPIGEDLLEDFGIGHGTGVRLFKDCSDFVCVIFLDRMAKVALVLSIEV